MRILVISFLVNLITFHAQAQAPEKNTINYSSFTGSIGSGRGTLAIDYFHLWRPGKSKKLEFGFGGRFTTYFGSSQYFSSAPPSLAADKNKSDSLMLISSQVNSLNLALNFGYRLSPKFGVGFNLDAIGFSFGASQSGNYINGNFSQPTSAKPTSFNILLVDNNDQGSLNSEFYLRYFLTDKFAVKAGFQHLFTEYTTDTKVQQQPENNDRFRSKSNLFSIGITITPGRSK